MSSKRSLGGNAGGSFLARPSGPIPDSQLRTTMSTPDSSQALYRRWDDIPMERLKGTITRRLITGARIMIGPVFFKKGDEVPRHSHENEQVTYVLQGALHFRLGATGDREVTVRAGEAVVIPSQLPPPATALEDTLEIDVFNPPRQDWL